MYARFRTLAHEIREQLRAQRLMFRRLFVLPLRRHWLRKIPVAMITGTKGKTTTSRMLANILSASGFHVGLATSDGIAVGKKSISTGTSSGYRQHAYVLHDKQITVAVLETARAGIRIHGLYIDNPDVCALLNVGRDHIEMDGISGLEQMAALKKQVVDVAKRAIILNADDPEVSRMIPDFPTEKTIVFSMNSNAEAVQSHLRLGGVAYCLDESEDARITRIHSGNTQTIIDIADLPSSWNGVVRHNIANAMAAAACAEGFGVSFSDIHLGLASFHNTIEQSPGRFNVLEGYPFLLIVDAADCPPAAQMLVGSLSKIVVSGQRRCMLESAGNRADAQLKEYASILADEFDNFVCYEQERYRRGRGQGEIATLLHNGLIFAGVSTHAACIAADYKEALDILADQAKPGDLIVVLGGPERENLNLVQAAFARHLQNKRQIDVLG